MGNYFSNIILFFYNKTKYKMNHISNFKDKLIMKPKDAHKLSKEEYREEVFKEKAKVTCQFIILVILSAIFAGIFYTLQPPLLPLSSLLNHCLDWFEDGLRTDEMKLRI